MSWKIFTIIFCTAAYTSMWWAVAMFGWFWGADPATPHNGFPSFVPIFLATLILVIYWSCEAKDHWND